MPTAPGHGRRGQALIVAVLVLFAVATLAALFAAIIGSQLAQVTRHSDVVKLRNMTEAGLWLANEQLTYSLKGADWRPSEDGYRFGGGRVDLSVTCWPPLGEQAASASAQKGRFLLIRSTAIFPDFPFLRYTIVALKPLLLTDYARFITDRFETNRPARLGVAGLELEAYQPNDYVFSIDGPIRSNTHLIAYGVSEVALHAWDEEAELDPDTGKPVTWANLRILRDDRIEVAGDLLTEPSHQPMLGLDRGDQLTLYVNPNVMTTPRIEDLFTPDPGVAVEPGQPRQDEDYAYGFPDWWRGGRAELSGRVLANLPGYWDGDNATWVSGPSLAVPRVQPPEIDAVHPDTQRSRYLLLTKESGVWRPDPDGEPYNTGECAFGWANFGGIYIDNGPRFDELGNFHPGDIQYNHNLEVLQRNWLASVGVHSPAGDERSDSGATQRPLAGPADWWDNMGRYYAPPGVEIILHGDELCPYIEIIRHDDPEADGKYWLDPTDPDVRTLSYEYSPATADPRSVCLPQLGSASYGIQGARAIFPFPPNGVIYAEGNARIRGIMPPLLDTQNRTDEEDLEAIPYREVDAVTGNALARRFDLQVVSGATIYIEGDLLSPASAGLLTDSTYSTDRYYGSRLALLARDSVCVNTTALNPRPTEVLQRLIVLEGEGEDQVERSYYYNDRYPYYPPGAHPRYLKFTGLPTPLSSTRRATDPASVQFLYYNVRLQSDLLRDTVSDLCLMLGHSAWYKPYSENGQPLFTENASVDMEAVMSDTDPAWAFGPYTFDKSGQWYSSGNQAEFLALELSGMAGTDPYTLTFTPHVTPVYDSDNGQWKVDPEDLAYLLGPLAITPPRYVEGTTDPAPPLEVRIEAMIYAQNGSWFVIPGPWFNEDPDEWQAEYETLPDYPMYREPLNIRISVFGAITENMPADLGAAAEWTSKWAGPVGQDDGGFLTYSYDPLLRWPRWDPESETWAARFPNLPITSDMLIWGERVSGQAGA